MARYFILIAVSITLLFSSGYLMTPDASLRLRQAEFLLEGNFFHVSAEVGDVTHGNVVDHSNGNRYSVYNPGQILLFVPAVLISNLVSSAYSFDFEQYHISAFWAAFYGPFFHGLTGFFVYRLVRVLGGSNRRALTVYLIYLFGTFSLPHSADGYEHVYEGLAISASLLLLLLSKLDDKRLIWGAASGIILGIGFVFRNTTFLALPGLMLLAYNRKILLPFAVAIIPFVLSILLYNHFRFGSPLETGYTTAWQAANPGVVMGSGFNILQAPFGASWLLFSPGKGLFFFSPVLLLTLLAIFKADRSIRYYMLPIGLIVLAYLGFYGSNFAWHGSIWSWGPRYIIPVVPLLCTCFTFVRIPEGKYLRVAFCSLVIVSVLVQLIATSVSYKRHLLRAHQETPRLLDSGAILYSLEESPILRQIDDFFVVLGNASENRELHSFLPDGPWVNESRTASIRMMLDSSIDLNSFNFWWVRAQYLDLGWLRVLALGIAGSALIMLFSGIYFIWRKA